MHILHCCHSNKRSDTNVWNHWSKKWLFIVFQLHFAKLLWVLLFFDNNKLYFSTNGQNGNIPWTINKYNIWHPHSVSCNSVPTAQTTDGRLYCVGLSGVLVHSAHAQVCHIRPTCVQCTSWHSTDCSSSYVCVPFMPIYGVLFQAYPNMEYTQMSEHHFAVKTWPYMKFLVRRAQIWSLCRCQNIIVL